MPIASVPFKFSHSFRYSAERVYAWATDFQPTDPAIFGRKGLRKVTRLADDVLVLSDTRKEKSGKRVTRRRLVCLYPERLAWTNTHLSGPNKSSQFLYELHPEGKGRSRLEFTGLQLEYLKTVTPAVIRARAKTIAKEDAATWAIIGRALAKDLG
jgi:hypothetical protein